MAALASTPYLSPTATATRALFDTVMAALAAGDTVAARAAARGLLALLEALPDTGGTVVKLGDHRPTYGGVSRRAA